MPIYKFKCETCSESVELILNDYNLDELQCNVCGGKMRKVPVLPSEPQFKGTGFPGNDNKKKSNPYTNMIAEGKKDVAKRCGVSEDRVK